jgi:hypothetical protein
VPKTTAADLASKRADLNAEYAALDQTEVSSAVRELVMSPDVLRTMDQLIPLYEVMSDDDALKQHVGNWIQVVRAVALLAKQ